MLRKLAPLMLAVVMCCQSCFLKSDTTGTADDIIHEFLYNGPGGPVLVAHEKVFHATSKSTGGGVTRISGYSNTRLSSYDAQTGKLLNRKVLGSQDDDALLLLALVNGQLWCVSRDRAIAIHTRDPRTFDIKLGADQLLQQSPELKGRLASPEWYELPQFFGYDATRGIILTDDQGYRYSLDPATLKTEKITDVNYRLNPFIQKDITGSTGIFSDSVSLRLSGDQRKTIMANNRPLAQDLSFLKGVFLLDRNQDRLQVLQQQQLREINMLITQQKDILDSLKSLTDTLARRTSAVVRTESAIRNAQYRIDQLVRQAANLGNDAGGRQSRLLQCSNGSFFVLQASSTNKDALLTVSCLQWQPGAGLLERWRTPLNGIFYDPGNAKETNAFKAVFSGGNPEFNFKWADALDNKILLTWMLHTVCLDLETGKVLWLVRH